MDYYSEGTNVRHGMASFAFGPDEFDDSWGEYTECFGQNYDPDLCTAGGGRQVALLAPQRALSNGDRAMVRRPLGYESVPQRFAPGAEAWHLGRALAHAAGSSRDGSSSACPGGRLSNRLARTHLRKWRKAFSGSDRELERGRRSIHQNSATRSEQPGALRLQRGGEGGGKGKRPKKERMRSRSHNKRITRSDPVRRGNSTSDSAANDPPLTVTSDDGGRATGGSVRLAAGGGEPSEKGMEGKGQGEKGSARRENGSSPEADGGTDLSLASTALALEPGELTTDLGSPLLIDDYILDD